MSDNTPVVEPLSLLEGSTFESTSVYRLIRRLGEGGMGDVWLAQRQSGGKHTQEVAIKFLRGLAHDAQGTVTLAEEARRMSHLVHDNIVPFVDSGYDHSGRFFVAMAYIDGLDLSLMRSKIGFSSDDVLAGNSKVRIPEPIIGFIIFMVLRALHYAHSYDFGDGEIGLIHRDVSPGNILVDKNGGFVKLTDFGVAVPQDTEQFEVAGKIPYIAPEVLTGESVDPRADIYSLGLVAYELITGFNPNVMPSQLESILSAISGVMLSIERPLRPPDQVVEGVNPKLSSIIVKMLSVDPNERYQNAEAVTADITSYLYDHGVGPTAGSMASYSTMVMDSEKKMTSRMKRMLHFLAGPDGVPIIFPQWRLTRQAMDDLETGDNPARI